MDSKKKGKDDPPKEKAIPNPQSPFLFKFK